MAARTAETDVSGSRRARAICAFAAILVLGLGLWRGAEVFSAPAGNAAPASLEQQSLLSLIEPLAGAGNVRLNVRRSGNGVRNYFVQIDTFGGETRPLAKEIEATLVTAVGFDATLGDTLTVREFPFAKGVTARPDTVELIELGVFGLLTVLLAWGAFAPSRHVPDVQRKTTTKRSEPNTPRRVRPVAVDLAAPAGTSAASAARTANEDPEGTAKIIRAWMRSPEDRA